MTTMVDEWKAAVAGGDAAKLSELVLSCASSEAALSVLRSCVSLLEKRGATGVTRPAIAMGGTGSAVMDSSNTKTTTNDSATSSIAIAIAIATASPSASLVTLENVQLLQPRGRFNLVFCRDGVTITGKAGAVHVSWDNVRHIMRLPRPEGFNWGKALNPDDPAGSDLVVIPLKKPVPFRKGTTSLILIQPDPKAKHSEVSVSLDGTSHQVSGSEGTLVMSTLNLLSGVRQVVPDRGLFATRDGKSFVKCYHGVNEGALFPLKQGLLFMKPALFLPRNDIEEVVCGRGGSATTRYVDLVVGMGVEDGQGGSTVTQEEFSNIERESLPSLQTYIQEALVAPRQREVKRAAKAEAAAEQQHKAASSDAATATSSDPATAIGSATGSGFLPSRSAPSTNSSGGSSSEPAAKVHQEEREEEEEDDGDAESDEDFAPAAGDTDSDDDSSSNDEAGEKDENADANGSNSSSGGDDEEDGVDDGSGGSDCNDNDGNGSSGDADRAEALKELDELAKEAAGGGGSGSGGISIGLVADRGGGGGSAVEGSIKRKKRRLEEDRVGGEESEDDGTESDEERGEAARKRQR